MNSHEECFCPKCGATLNDQNGFDPGNGNWSCASCGQELYGDDVYEGDIYPGIMWHCDQCGALLNKQDGFKDSCGSWTCTECRHSNPISEDAILYE
jgi:DNA-directed RNA polymerase subunit M/transcription elongation factor TFIIS